MTHKKAIHNLQGRPKKKNIKPHALNTNNIFYCEFRRIYQKKVFIQVTEHNFTSRLDFVAEPLA